MSALLPRFPALSLAVLSALAVRFRFLVSPESFFLVPPESFFLATSASFFLTLFSLSLSLSRFVFSLSLSAPVVTAFSLSPLVAAARARFLALFLLHLCPLCPFLLSILTRHTTRRQPSCSLFEKKSPKKIPGEGRKIAATH